MERKQALLKTGCLRTLMVSMAVMLCAAPILRADVTVPAGEEWDIDGDVGGALLVSDTATANVLPGAVITDGLLVDYGGTANIYGGSIAPYISSVGIQLTVYGTDFTIGDIPKDYGEHLLYGMGKLAGKYGDGTSFSITIYSASVNLQPPPSDVIEVTIDIKPGSDPNPINQGSNGVIPVAILTTDTFDASTVDPGSVTLAGAEIAVRGKSDKLMAHLEDVDGDGDDDLLLQIDTQSDGAVWETGPVSLEGTTYDGQAIEGTDDIVIVPPE